ncbi:MULTISPECIES: flagellar protein FlaG [Brevibacillus]|uniref:flagellar protein FlaG n=1 Tax=Brevibacillus TaxID=55080 RepID=UPI001133EDC5|nr:MULTISPECIES: flagellar protein FlaG [Brevibacillus]MDR9507288.1 flagellar protein FlaG [Brevibacillus agri]TGV11960.1 flagellar protein FlaG [Mesorhizobium sp. M00.F.Ca.ET.186.01.1.1]
MSRIEGNLGNAFSTPLLGNSRDNALEERQSRKAENKTEDYPGNNIKEIDVNNLLDGETYLQFSYHKETQSIVVKVLNKNTKEVLREIPSEKILEMISSLNNSVKGIFLDKKS